MSTPPQRPQRPEKLTHDNDLSRNMSTHPDFDNDWRKHDAAARAAEFTVQNLVNDDNGPNAAAIQSAVKELHTQHLICQKLSERINAAYKGLKREYEAQSIKATAADKLKEEKKHAVTKAKEYREQVKILEKKVIDLGGSTDDVKPTVVKNRKRGIDQVEIEDNLTQQPPKRPKKTEMMTKSKNSTPQLATPSPSDSSTTSKRSAPSEFEHTTPMPRAKRSRFKKDIPFNQEKKFAASRMLIPNKLHDPTKHSSHVTAVLQGLAASVKSHEAYHDLPQEAKDAKDFRLLRNDSEINKEVHKQSAIPPSKAFVDFIADLQHEGTRPLNTHPLQRHIELQGNVSSKITDPAMYLEQVLQTVTTTYIDHAFKAAHTIQHFCHTCHTIPTYEDSAPARSAGHTDFDLLPPTVTESKWITDLKPTFTEREMRYYGKPAARNLDALLSEKVHFPQYINCKKCGRDNSKLAKHWKGFAYSPSIISFSFDRSTHSKQYKLTLPLESDFAPYVQASGEKTKYRLVTVIKKLKSEMYAAFVHTEDGKWWRCINEQVRECRIEEWQGDEKNGETVMAFYERLDD